MAFQNEFYCSSTTLKEIENIKTSSRKDYNIKYKARKLSKLFDENNNYKICNNPNDLIQNKLELFHMEDTPDNRIITDAFILSESNKDLIFITNDISCKNIAKNIFGLNVSNIETNIEDYKGYLEIYPTDEELANIYQNMNINSIGLLTNQYVIVRNSDNEVIDCMKWNGSEYRGISYKNINNPYVGQVKPRNTEQTLAMDLLQTEDIPVKVLTGRYGVGKDFLMISQACELLSKGKIDKLVWVRNTVGVKDAKEIGFIPGDIKEKLWPYAMILADHLGDELALDSMIQRGKIELQALNFMRGRSYKNTIIYCSEAENLTKEHIQLLLSRCDKGSQLWLNGDYKHQVDDKVFETNNGLKEAIECLKGNRMFGCVELQKVERDKVAGLADLLD